MAYFVVNYDLRDKEPSDYEHLIEVLNKMLSVEYQESCWFVDQKKTCKQLFEILKKHVQDNDRLTVVEFSEKPVTNKTLKGTANWINERFSS